MWNKFDNNFLPDTQHQNPFMFALGQVKGQIFLSIRDKPDAHVSM